MTTTPDATGDAYPEWDLRDERLFMLALESIDPSPRNMSQGIYGALADVNATTLDRLTPEVEPDG